MQHKYPKISKGTKVNSSKDKKGKIKGQNKTKKSGNNEKIKEIISLLDLESNEEKKEKANKIKNFKNNESKTGTQNILDKDTEKEEKTLKTNKKEDESLKQSNVENQKDNKNTEEENSSNLQTVEEKKDDQIDNYTNEVIEYLEQEKPMILKEPVIKQIKKTKKDLKKR